ncbi:MAG: glycine reductase [Spirochaetaceae bacterium]|nr:MAG: glycine reductase [Spirochaetaceae bacterium]
MSNTPVLKACAYELIHTPDLVRHGSKPRREVLKDPGLERRIAGHLRSYQEAVEYPPNQVFLGAFHPEDLASRPQPWWQNPCTGAPSVGSYGRLLDQLLFYAYLKASDQFDLLWFTGGFSDGLKLRLQNDNLAIPEDLEALGEGKSIEAIAEKIENQGALGLYQESELVGCIQRHHDEDESLQAHILLENIATKASGALVVRELLARFKVDPGSVDFLLSCSEEAVGDRYNRGGGSMAKAVGEMCGLSNATGCDLKAFCAAPIYAIVQAASMVQAGVFKNVIVFGGGCLAKLGMKFAGHLKHDMPILEDQLACIAFLITADDGISPLVRLDSVGKHNIGDGSSQQEILSSLVYRPLEKIGLRISEIDKIATELHNPEITLPQGSGNVPLNNYKMIAALGVMRGEMDRSEISEFVNKKGMPGFAPTQGHIPAAVPYLGHAREAMAKSSMQRVLFVAKGSLFLGRMTQLFDGMSFILEKNPKLT